MFPYLYLLWNTLCQGADIVYSFGSESGLIFKKFRSTPNPQGYYFSLKVRQGGNETDITVPLSMDEFRLFQIIAQYCLPNLMGVDRVFGEWPHKTRGL